MPKSKKPARTRKQPTAQTSQTGWFTIRRILDERRIANRIEYLVDWDDDAKTGQAHEPTWARSADVTALAKREWKNSKASSDAKSRPARSETSASQGDQSPRPANLRQLKRTKSESRARTSSAASGIEAGPARKRLRYSPSPSTEPVPSIMSGPSPSPAFDSPEIEGPTHAPTELIVDVPKEPNFDPSEFLSVAGSQSQSTSHPSQSLIEFEEQDQRIAFSSQISLRTVPDSQGSSGQPLSTASLHKTIENVVSSLPESDCAVIPDSPERETSRVIVPTEAGNLLQERIPESSFSFPAEPNANANFVIPSGQLEARDQSFYNVPGLNSTQPSPNQPSRSPRITVGDSLQASLAKAPEFLTQVEMHLPSTFLSSLPRQEQSYPPSEATASAALQASHRASQDAQVVHNFFDTVLERVTDSNETDTTSEKENSVAARLGQSLDKSITKRSC